MKAAGRTWRARAPTTIIEPASTMTRRIFRRLSCASVLLLAACAKPGSPAPAPVPFSGLREQWETAFNRADTTTLVALYAPDAVLIPPVGTVLTGGHVAARMTLGREMESRTLKLNLTHQRSTEHVGHLQGTWQARRRGVTGGPLLATGTYVMLFEKTPEGRWSIAYHTWSEDRVSAPNRADTQARR